MDAPVTDAPRVGDHIALRRGRGVVKRIYTEKYRWISVTIAVVTPTDKTWNAKPLELIMYPRDEGVWWARGWNTDAASALRVVAALS